MVTDIGIFYENDHLDIQNVKTQAEIVEDRNIAERLPNQTEQIRNLVEQVRALSGDSVLQHDQISTLQDAVANVHTNSRNDFDASHTKILSGLVVSVNKLLSNYPEH